MSVGRKCHIFDTGHEQHSGKCRRQCNFFRLHVPTVNEPQEETRWTVRRELCESEKGWAERERGRARSESVCVRGCSWESTRLPNVQLYMHMYIHTHIHTIRSVFFAVTACNAVIIDAVWPSTLPPLVVVIFVADVALFCRLIHSRDFLPNTLTKRREQTVPAQCHKGTKMCIIITCELQNSLNCLLHCYKLHCFRF